MTAKDFTLAMIRSTPEKTAFEAYGVLRERVMRARVIEQRQADPAEARAMRLTGNALAEVYGHGKFDAYLREIDATIYDQKRKETT